MHRRVEGAELGDRASLADAMMRVHVAPLCRELKALSNELGGEGKNYRAAREAMDCLINRIRRMREGEA